MRVAIVGIGLAVILVGCGGVVESTPPTPCEGNGVAPGSSCSTKGDQCWSNEPLYCTDIPPSCTCDGHTWQCQSFDCPACPSASSIVDGAFCSDTRFDCPATMTCAGESVATSCSCMAGRWSCAPACGGGVDAGAPD